MKKAIFGMLVTIAVVASGSAQADSGLFARDKLSRCNLPSHVEVIYQSFGDDILTWFEKERLRFYDKRSQAERSLEAGFGEANYCGLLKKLVPRAEAWRLKFAN